MSSGRPSDVATEQGFGTGLRAQLARRRPSDESACAELPGEIAEVLALLESQSIDPAAVQRLRAELEASFAREQELRGARSVGAAEPAASASELHAFEIALEERERELALERAELDEERATLGGIESELALTKARSDKLEGQIEEKVTQLKEADFDRRRLERELRVREVDLSAGTADQTRELDGRERALAMRAEELVEREERLERHGAELAAQERALAVAIDQLAEKSEELRDLELSLDARGEEIEELHQTVQADIERLAEATGGDPDKVRDVLTIIDSLEERENALEEREGALEEREGALEEREEEVGKQLADARRKLTEAERRNADAATLESSLGRRERELDKREREIESTNKLVEERLRRLERKERRVEQIEASHEERVAGLEQREAEAYARERRAASIEADCGLREQRLERREHAVEANEKRLTRKEQDLQGWVGPVQSDLTEQESDWWAKQLGQAEVKEASSEKEPGNNRLRVIN